MTLTKPYPDKLILLNFFIKSIHTYIRLLWLIFLAWDSTNLKTCLRPRLQKRWRGIHTKAKKHLYSFVLNCRGGSNKMHQGGNYQDFLKWEWVVFRSFSYNSWMNLKDFFSQNLQYDFELPSTVRCKRANMNIAINIY